ncbi:MAG TPA: hypothetical protein DCY00_03390, partial [Actinobacteria bacterium]|nr:hypothetical protein [Actinomycetota bacterium]
MDMPGIKNTVKTSIFSVILVFSSALQLFPDAVKILDFNQNYYSINKNRGFELSSDRGKTWNERSDGLPDKIIYPFDRTEKRTLTSISINQDNVSIITATSVDSLYITDNNGEKWRKVSLSGPVKP